MTMKKITIIGGGIAGLAAAYYAQQRTGEGVAITILEAGEHWGGKITTDRVDDVASEGQFVIEGGPDTFIVTKPWALRLCTELGIADRLRGTNPKNKATYILKKDRLHELPGGLTMMIPTEFGPMIRTGLLSWAQKARMGLDFVLPAPAKNGDESLGNFVSRRLGRAAYENLIEPLMSGIYAGDGDQLSLRATFPYLRDLELKEGGLIKGALAARKARASKGGGPNPGSRSIFMTPITGLAEIVETLTEKLATAGVEMRLKTSASELSQLADGGWQVTLTGGEAFETETVIIAAPAYVAGALIADTAPDLAADLAQIEYVSTSTVTMAFKQEDLPRPLDGYGYVIPRREGRKALACTWTSTKFPHRAPEGYALVRVFIGRAGQEDEISWTEEDLESIAREELAMTLGIRAEPLVTRIFRWEKAMPQYNLGHPARLERITAALSNLQGLGLAGNGYTGIGIPDCIRSGELAVEKILEDRDSSRTEPIEHTAAAVVAQAPIRR